jgi:DNA adenine methylase
MEKNSLLDGHYIEPYAGGAGLALTLMLREYMRVIHLNDYDRSIYAFWYSIMNNTEEFCSRIENTPITITEWYKQRKIQADQDDVSLLDLGFSSFFLNRTNRSGIIKGGVIGGYTQTGNWKIDARFNKNDLLERINLIVNNKARMHIYNMDAIDFLKKVIPTLPQNSLVYLDPPYYVKGKQLYTNFYNDEDHKKVANYILSLKSTNWIVSYDNVDSVKKLYEGTRYITYDLSYSAGKKHRGSEIMFFSDSLSISEEDIYSCKGVHNINTENLLSY